MKEKYNIYVLVTEAYGYVVQFRLYQGAKKGKRVVSSTKWVLGKDVVLRPMKCLTWTFSFNRLLGNYFTSFCLLTHLELNTISAKVWSTKIDYANEYCTKQLQKEERSHLEQRTSSKKAVKLWQRLLIMTAGNLRKRLKESIFNNNNQINCTVTTRVWVLWTEWTRN